VYGILNGMDYDVWNPQTDRNLARPFDVAVLDQRIENKRALQERLGLPRHDDVPVLSMVTRLDAQKGIEILGHVLHLLMNNAGGEAQFVIVGTGASIYEDMLRQLGGYHRNKMRGVLAYAADLAPLVYGGSDMFLMPSLFEPCGLGQMIAMRYGNVPVVRATGGLADTVRDGVTGFVFNDFSVEAFWSALRGALYIYNIDKESWRAIQVNGMTSDFSWRNSALGYQQLYERAIARMGGEI
jgi:starch synthase